MDGPVVYAFRRAGLGACDGQRAFKAGVSHCGPAVVDSILAKADDVRARHMMVPPYVVKPNNEGSSVGIYIVHDAANSPPQLSDDMPDVVMVETFAPGREMTTSVMGAGTGTGQDTRALCVTDILTDGWYDYDAKYKEGGSRHVLPADIPAEMNLAMITACVQNAFDRVRGHR